MKPGVTLVVGAVLLLLLGSGTIALVRNRPAPEAHTPALATSNAATSISPTEGQAPSVPSASKAASREKDVASMSSPSNRILEEGNVAQAIKEARATYGDSALLADIETTAAFACTMDVDPMGALLKGPPDSGRLWAAQTLIERCKGWSDLPKNLYSSTPSPVDIARTRGKPAGFDEAMRLIRTSNRAIQLQDAGWLLLENDDSRIMQVNGIDPDLGFQERLKSWIFASTLWECETQGGCGSQHLLTLAFCVNAGCREGSTYREALANATSAREMRATEAFLAWIRASRR